MAILSFLLVFFAGLLIVQRLASSISVLEKVAFAFPIGMGSSTLLMFLLDISHLGIHLWKLLMILLAIIGVLWFWVGKTTVYSILHNWKALQIRYTLGWFFLLALSVYMLYAIGLKNTYWPPAEHDSLTGYDLQAKMIANEGTFVTSQFQYPYYSTYELARFIYPPLSAASFAFAYMAGMAHSKIVVLLLYFSLLLAFYALLRKSISDTWALLATFFVMITPEMFSHASLALTNLPNAVYTALAVLCLYYWLVQNDKSYFNLSLVCMLFSNWSRSDSIVFVIAAVMVIILVKGKSTPWLSTLYYALAGIVPFIIWTLFVKLQIGANASDFFVKTLFWDGEKLQSILSKCMVIVLGNSVYYGITFFVFVALTALNIVDLIQKRHAVAVFIIVAWMGYTFLYYQIDYSFAGSVDAYINASYKRGMFNFVPLCWFFIATSPFSLKWLHKADMYFNQ